MIAFPRGSGPLVSVLLPTRRGRDHLCRTIDSIWSLALNKASVEFILKVDDDDKETIQIAKELENFPGLSLRSLISPRGKGYSEIYLALNEMSTMARGDWLLVFNDDARLLTQGWDYMLEWTIIQNPWFGCWDVCLLNAKTKDIYQAKQFPLLRKKTCDILGHFSPSPRWDTWINGVMDFIRADIVDVLCFEVDHLENVLKDDFRDASWQEMKKTAPTIHSIDAKFRMLQDCFVLLKYLKELHGKTSWIETPTHPGWHYWDIDGGEGKFVFVDDKLKTSIYETGEGGIHLAPMVVDRGKLTLLGQGPK